MKKQNKIKKNRKIKHEVKVIGIALAILVLLLFVKIIGFNLTGFDVYRAMPLPETDNQTAYSQNSTSNTTTNQDNTNETINNNDSASQQDSSVNVTNENTASSQQNPLPSTSGYGTESYSIMADTTWPTLDFVEPTPTNNTATTNASQEINISIAEANLREFIWNWNGTNYTIYNDSLVFMMNFDNNTEIGENDTYAVDISNYSSNGTFGNGTVSSRPNWTTSGRYGSGILFDGNDDYINISGPSPLRQKNATTYSFWVNISTGGNVMGAGAQNGNGFGGISLIQTYVLFAWTADDGNGDLQIINYTTFAPGTWYYITITMNYDTGTYAIYINGSSVTADISRVPTNYHPMQSYSAGKPDIIGGRYVNNYNYFNGTIDEIMIFNRSLTAPEVYQLYKTNLKKYDPTNWAFYTNQTLDGINHTYFASAQDQASNANKTDVRQTLYGAADVSETVLSVCNNINVTGELYTLSQSISVSGSCITIANNSIVLDCQGYTITGDNSSGSIGISAASYSNITIKNCRIYDFIEGIKFSSVANSTIDNNTIKSNNETGATIGVDITGTSPNNAIYNTYAETQNSSSSLAAIYVLVQNTTIINSTGKSRIGTGIAPGPNNTITNSSGISDTGFGIDVKNNDFITLDNVYGN